MSVYDNLDRAAAVAYDAGAAAERERIVQLIHLIRVLHKPVKETFTALNGTPGMFIRCHGCDQAPHFDDYPEWPCATAELVFTPEERKEAVS